MPVEYFARLPAYSKELGGRLLAMVNAHYRDLPSLRMYQRARRTRQLYYGLPSEASPFDVTTVARMGDAGELSAINLNRVHHLGQRFLTMGVSEDFGWQPVAANGDTQSQEEAILAGSVLEHEKRASNLEKVRHQFNELSLLDGWSFFSVRWDPAAGPQYDTDPDTGAAIYEGRLKVGVHEWWRVVTDLNRQDANHEWAILTEFANRWDLAERWAKEKPDVYERIIGLPPENEFVLNWQQLVRNRRWTPEESPQVPVYTLFHKPTPAVPQGREVVLVSDGTILFDGPSVYGEEMPVYRVAANDLHGTPFGVSILADIVAPQQSVNALLSTTLTNNINHGLTNIAVKREANFNIAHVGGAAVWELDGNPKDDIVPMNLVASSPETGNLAKFLLSEMETLTGMNSVALGRQEHQMAASLAALLDQKAREFAGFFVRGDKLAVTQLGTAILRCYRQFARAPRVLEVIAGEGRRYMLESFTGQQLGSISRVTVAVRSGMLSTPSGQMAFAETLVKTGALENPQALRTLTSVYTRGNLDVALMPLETEDMLIARENDLIARGQTPKVRSTDNHVEHIKRHGDPMANPAAREDDAAAFAADQHLQAHIMALRTLDPALLQILGQPALPQIPGVPDPSMLPPGAPPGGGAAPAAAMAGLPPGAPPPDLEGGPISSAMAGNPPNLPNLPQPAQPPPSAPPPLA